MKAIHVLTIALALSMALAGLALANSSPQQRRQVLGGGASEATAGTIHLRGTLGQPIVGDISARGVVLEQGFWHGARYHIYLPLVTRNDQP